MKTTFFDMRLFVVGYLVICMPVSMFTDAYAQGSEGSLDWKIEASPKTVFPGEPVLLTLKITNTGNQEAKIDFGMDGIEAFAMEIKNSSNEIVTQGDHIQRYGLTRSGSLIVSPGKTTEKSIVLNEWCSTLLPSGQYHIACRVDRPGQFYSEKIKSTDDNYTAISKRHYLPIVALELDIQIIGSDDSGLKSVLNGLAKRAFTKDPNTVEELADREIAREMLVFTESVLAVPHQLQLLKSVQSTWLKWDAIDSLAKSKSLDAANGLIQFAEDTSVDKDEVKQQIVEAIYKLRKTEKADILSATNNFVAKYKRPVLAKPVD